MSDAFRPRIRLPVLIPLLLACAGLVVAGVFAFREWSPRTKGTEEAARTLPSSQSPPSPTAPAPVPHSGSEQVGPSFDVVRINPGGQAVIAGHAAPGAEVSVRDAGRDIGRTVADAQGSWVLLPSEPMPGGARELTLSARDPDGRETQGQGSVLLVVPERSAAASSGETPPIAVLTGKDAAPRLLQAPGSGAELPASSGAKPLGLAAAEYDEHGAVRFAGTAPPGATVRLYVDDHPAGDAVADADGRWVLRPETWIEPGSHRLRLDQLTSSGKVAARAEAPFRREMAAPGEIGRGKVVVQRGQNLWQLARRVYGSGLRYTVIYDANREQIRDPHRIYPGQIFAVPAPAHAGRRN